MVVATLEGNTLQVLNKIFYNNILLKIHQFAPQQIILMMNRLYSSYQFLPCKEYDTEKQ